MSELDEDGKPKAPSLMPVRYVVIGTYGGVLNYVRAWATEAEAEADQERVGKNYGIEYTEDNGWHNDDNDVWIATDDGSY